MDTAEKNTQNSTSLFVATNLMYLGYFAKGFVSANEITTHNAFLC